MTTLRAALLAAAALFAAAPLAWSDETPALPPGLTRSGGTIMMQPVGGDAADAPVPGDDSRASTVHILSPSDHDIYSKAFQAADRGDWLAAKGLADQGRDPVARKLVLWRYALAPSGGASFDEIDSFIKANPGWPLQAALAERAEHAMPPAMAPQTVLAWFAGREPKTAIGMIRLGDALLATGKASEGRELIRKAWRDGDFAAAEELDVIARDGNHFTSSDQKTRLERLIWKGDLAGARRQLARVDTSTQRVAEVRLALRSTPRSFDALYDALPAGLRGEPLLELDRAKELRGHGDRSVFSETLIKAPLRELAKIDPARLWGQVALATRESIENRDYRLAYRLVSESGLEDGDEYSDAQFLAGWLALRFLEDPVKAATHFKNLAAHVSRPISLARAHYWLGRTYEVDGRTKSAAREYRVAADNPETFYGQLALARLDPGAKLKLTVTPADPQKAARAYETDEQSRAIHILADLGAARFLRIFAVYDAQSHPEAPRIAALSADLVRMGFRDIALRVAKVASYTGVDLPAYTHPVIALPAYRGPGAAPEEPLVLALIRQETEFSPGAVSRVGARGLMQVMPSSGKHLAQLAGMPWKPAALGGDETYNLELGMTELSGHLANWGGSYILAAAGYNAGDTNVQRWIADYGDPRGNIDPIDWIELIPFSETRNYVQRVIENVEVYRDRIAGKSEPLRILADLYRPLPPPSVSPLPAPSAANAARDVPVPSARPAPGSGIVLPAPLPRPAAIIPPAEAPSSRHAAKGETAERHTKAAKKSAHAHRTRRAEKSDKKTGSTASKHPAPAHKLALDAGKKRSKHHASADR